MLNFKLAQFFFAYRIRITMGSHMSKDDECQLTTRHWVITDGTNHVEEVQGPGTMSTKLSTFLAKLTSFVAGVIGKYPKAFPGMPPFEYASCCPIPTVNG